ncbi:hypothetical protein X777_10845 [Ooceraea biroi]|uniref:Uncharacterized protein n=1 Tax=Ooceraea biroi TaxID=2015173 RepID=A0A026W3X8_OOCBI|nr:hypothetical protein X777_10845 [Ooceraea biroi]
MRGPSYLLGFLFSNLLSAFVSAYGATGTRIVPVHDVPISGHKGRHTYRARDPPEFLSIDIPSRRTLVRIAGMSMPLEERRSRPQRKREKGESRRAACSLLFRAGGASVQACSATWKIVRNIDGEGGRTDFYPLPSSPSFLRPLHHVPWDANGYQQLPNADGCMMEVISRRQRMRVFLKRIETRRSPMWRKTICNRRRQGRL